MTHDEPEAGVSGFAAPVFDGAGVAIAAIGVVAPTARMPSPADLAPSVVTAAAAVSERLAEQRSRSPGPASVGA
jgi:DNA-binding IclR family transcriptional regulator